MSSLTDKYARGAALRHFLQPVTNLGCGRLWSIPYPQWNPLAEFVKPGDAIVIKPNLVLHEMKGTEGTNCVVTHASVLRPLIDYCVLAGGPECAITVCDVPLQSADLDAVVERNGLRGLVEYYQQARGLNVQLLDLRPVRQQSSGTDFFLGNRSQGFH